MTFTQFNFSPDISKGILASGYSTPTPIQIKSIPNILNKKDLVASAPTGTGKTAAFVLPALELLSLNKSTHKPRLLILTPTRELASQITQAVRKYGKFLKINSVSLVGGMPYGQQIRDLSRTVDIIIATPGRLIDHLESGRLDLSGIEMLVLDEADRMLDMGFIDDVMTIANATPHHRQTLLFSATVDNSLTRVIQKLLKNPVRVDFSHEAVTPSQIKQELYKVDHVQHKHKLLQHFLKNENIFKAIIFTATKIHADQLAKQLSKQGISAAPLHGDLRQNVRNRTVEQMRQGKIQFLIATDVAARGINIADISHVINFDLPKFSEDYVHRIGRTGRAGKTGIAISFVAPADQSHLKKIERYISQRLSFSVIPGLEPTNRPVSNDSKPSKKRRGKSFGGGGRFDGPRSEKRKFDGPKHDRDDRFDGKRSEKRKFDGPKRDRDDRFGGQRSEKRKFNGPKRDRDDRSGGHRSEKRKFDGPKRDRDDRFGDKRSEKRKFDGPRRDRNDRFDNPRSEKRSFDGDRPGKPERFRDRRSDD